MPLIMGMPNDKRPQPDDHQELDWKDDFEVLPEALKHPYRFILFLASVVLLIHFFITNS